MNHSPSVRSGYAAVVRRPRGFATIPVLVFLAVAVVFLLTQTLSITGTKVTDDVAHHDSTRALYIAESGLEFATGVVSAAAISLEKLEQVCKALDSLSPPAGLELGNGLVKIRYLSFEAPPDNEDIRRCEFSATSVFGNATRVLVKKGTFERQKGIAGFGGAPSTSRDQIEATVVNAQSQAGFAIFNLAWRKQGSDGIDPLSCINLPEPCELTGYATTGQASANPCSGCSVEWNIESSAGSVSVGALGTVKPVNPSETSKVTQTLSADRNFVEVGLVLTGDGEMVKRGSFSNDSAPTGQGTVSKNSTAEPTGTVPNGALGDYLIELAVTGRISASTSTATVTAASGPSTDFRKLLLPGDKIYVGGNFLGTVKSTSNKTFELEQNAAFTFTALEYKAFRGGGWCSRADTIVFGVSGRSNPATLQAAGLFSTQLTSVTFGETSGSPPGSNGGFPLDLIATYPSSSRATPGASGDIFAQVWAAYNPFFIAKVQSVVNSREVRIVDGDPSASISFDAKTFNLTDKKQTVVGLYKPASPTLASAVPPQTVVTAYDSAAKTLRFNNPVTLSAGDIICGGLCAFFDHKSAGETKFWVGRDTRYVDQWAGGFTCFSGTDREQIRSINGNAQSIAVQWHEVIK